VRPVDGAGGATRAYRTNHADSGLRPRMGARTLGERLRLCNADRELFRIKTIRPFDKTPWQLEQQRKAKRRRRQIERRRKAGTISREQYLATANKSALKPWLAEGVRRRTWYRRRKRDAGKMVTCDTASPRGTSLKPINIYKQASHLCHPLQEVSMKVSPDTPQQPCDHKHAETQLEPLVTFQSVCGLSHSRLYYQRVAMTVTKSSNGWKRTVRRQGGRI